MHETFRVALKLISSTVLLGRAATLVQSAGDTQQTVSVNNCSENLLSPKFFGLKCDEKLEFSLAQIFVIWGKYCLLFSER